MTPTVLFMALENENKNVEFASFIFSYMHFKFGNRVITNSSHKRKGETFYLCYIYVDCCSCASATNV